MKKIKMILICLLLCITTINRINVGTYGIFSSIAESKSNIFQTGNLQILLDYSPNELNIEGGVKEISLDYGKFAAGDSISREFYIKNCGSLPFISRISISEQNNLLYNYLMCQVNIYYKEQKDSNKDECKYILYNDALNKLSESTAINYEKYIFDNSITPIFYEIKPDEILKCEMILTLPEDVTLPNQVLCLEEIENNDTSLAKSKNNNSIIVKIDATQINNTNLQGRK